MRQYSNTFSRWQATNLSYRREWFDTEAEAIAHEATGGPQVEYRGFVITPLFHIYKNDVQVFGAWWQMCSTLDEAKRMIDLSCGAVPCVFAPSIGLTDTDDPDNTRWLDLQAELILKEGER